MSTAPEAKLDSTPFVVGEGEAISRLAKQATLARPRYDGAGTHRTIDRQRSSFGEGSAAPSSNPPRTNSRGP